MDFESVRLITFDCYGTLIDWETGMLAALRPLFSRNGHRIFDDRLLEEYGEVEAELEAGAYLPYRHVLSRTVEEMGRRWGMDISADDGRRFAESLTRWEPFPDKKKLPVAFDVIVTAQQVQSYKPSLKNFEEAVRRSGLKKEEILHAGQSVYHDIVPADFLGIKNIWVNRPSIRPGSGAAKPAVAQPSAEVRSLAELVELVSR